MCEEIDVSVVVPIYNEEKTLPKLLERLKQLPSTYELLFVDDGSTDQGKELVTEAKIGRVFSHQSRMGKGAAIRTALGFTRGKVVIIQDADLEYSPSEIPRIVAPVLNGSCSACYGIRFQKGFPPNMAWPNRIINRLLTLQVRWLYGHHLKDEATCYKAVSREVLKNLELNCKGFEFCPEVTAKLLKSGHNIVEIPLQNYKPRTKKEGKKIRWTDGVLAIYTLWKYRHWRPLKASSAHKQL